MPKVHDLTTGMVVPKTDAEADYLLGQRGPDGKPLFETVPDDAYGGPEGKVLRASDDDGPGRTASSAGGRPRGK